MHKKSTLKKVFSDYNEVYDEFLRLYKPGNQYTSL